MHLVDSWLYRYPFEGASAIRYALRERPGFGDLDQRLVAAWNQELAAAQVILDVGAGPGVWSRLIARRYPKATVIAAEPSRAYNLGPTPGVYRVRATAEALPLASSSVDVGVMISVIRHVRDRVTAFRELRRVIRPGGCGFVVELDPAAGHRRWRRHVRGMRSLTSRIAFAPLVLWTTPPADTFINLARTAGWRQVCRADDPEQPVYTLRLS